MDKGLVDYTRCITNLTSSIERYYGLEPRHNTLREADEVLLSKQWKNVIVFCCDAMGNAVLDRHRLADTFLLDNKVCEYVSCFPPTTATCTTSYMCGLNASESGWVGWASYFRNEDVTLENFTNRYDSTKEPYKGERLARKYMPYKKIGTRIEELGNGVVYYDMTPNDPSYDFSAGLEKRIDKLIERCNEEGRHFINFYWPEPDHEMHLVGTGKASVARKLEEITRQLHRLQDCTENTLAFVSADHGMADVKRIKFWKHRDINALLRAFPSCDARSPFFWVKDGRKQEFRQLFEKYFGKHYDLYTKEEVLDAQLFGTGEEHPLFRDFIGDFVGIARDEYYFSFARNHTHFKGHHAGLMDCEMSIPLICIRS